MRQLRPGQKTALVIAASFFFAAAAAVGLTFATIPRPKSVEPLTSPPTATPFLWPGKTRPPTVPASAAGLADDEPVIGVLVAGKARAYRRDAFAGLTNHVVNDVVGQTPVTVTYCDRTRCSRVFTGNGTEPLHVMTGGYTDGMLLYVDGVFYDQVTGEKTNDPDRTLFPYQPLGFEETTWARWRKAHPDTDVYVGAPEDGPTGPRKKE